MTEQEAKNLVEENNKKASEVFCPLINCMCQSNCVCFSGSNVYIRLKDDYRATQSGCENVMFFGE